MLQLLDKGEASAWTLPQSGDMICAAPIQLHVSRTKGISAALL
jgi:hypothetical protein